jgi:hypothetical protein
MRSTSRSFKRCGSRFQESSESTGTGALRNAALAVATKVSVGTTTSSARRRVTSARCNGRAARQRRDPPDADELGTRARVDVRPSGAIS